MRYQHRIIETRRVSSVELRANPANFRRHPDSQRKALRGSLETVGKIAPLIAYMDPEHGLTLIDGHARLSEDGEWDVSITDLSRDEAALAIALLDPIAAMAETDKDALALLLSSIETDNAAVLGHLNDLADANAIPHDDDPTPLDDDPTVVDKADELLQKWQVQVGDVYRIGEHTLVCGDCTDEAVVKRALQGRQASAVITDPPYGINREGITNDAPETLRQLYDGCLSHLPMSEGICVAWQSPRLFWVWLDAIRAAGHKFERMLWMYKPNDETFPWRGWLLKSEAILLSTIGKGMWQDVHPYSHDVYSPTTMGKELDGISGWHASVKPLGMVCDILLRTSRTGDLIYDPFCGSGTTLVACEQEGRIGVGIELEPKYCAVILERLTKLGLEVEKQ